MDLRTPLGSMGGQTALEVAKAAYKLHVSQQRYSFIVSDDYEHSCAEFGLYRTKVGYDTGNSMLEHIVLYSEQERLAKEEQERLAREALRAQKEAAVRRAFIAAAAVAVLIVLTALVVWRIRRSARS